MQLNRLKEAQDRVQATLAKAKALYGVDIKPEVRIDIEGRVAGWAKCQLCRTTFTRRYTLRLNRDLVLGDKHHQDMLDETIPHEVAHLVCYARPDLGRKHNDGWRRVCLALGGNGNTRHSYEVDFAAGGYRYRAECGTEIVVSRIIHQRIQAGSVRIVRKTRGRIDRYCPWAEDGQPLRVTNQRPGPRMVIHTNDPVVARAFAQPARPQAWSEEDARRAMANVLTGQRRVAAQRAQTDSPAVREGRTKAEVVRNMIREAKASGQGQEAVIERVVQMLEMKRAQAARYVVENWGKV